MSLKFRLFVRIPLAHYLSSQAVRKPRRDNNAAPRRRAAVEWRRGNRTWRPPNPRGGLAIFHALSTNPASGRNKAEESACINPPPTGIDPCGRTIDPDQG